MPGEIVSRYLAFGSTVERLVCELTASRRAGCTEGAGSLEGLTSSALGLPPLEVPREKTSVAGASSPLTKSAKVHTRAVSELTLVLAVTGAGGGPFRERHTSMSS
jgi:hypothetical protein